MVAFGSGFSPIVSLWPETHLLSIPQFRSIFNKLVAGAVLKRDIAESDGNVLLDADRGIEVAILKQSLETERFFTGY